MNHQTTYVPQIAYQSPQVTTQPMTKSPLMDSGFAIPVFSLRDDPIACLNKAMAFLTVVTSSRGDKVKVILVLVIRVMLLVLGETMLVDKQGLLNATTVKDKAMLAKAQEAEQILDEEQLVFLTDPRVPDGQAAQTIIPNNAAFQIEDLDTYDSECDDISNAKAVLMANISNYGFDIISEVPYSETYLNDMENQSMHAMQDFEQTLVVDVTDNEITKQMINHVNNWEKANKEQSNKSVTVELERYKERVKTFEQSLNIDLSSREKMIDSQMDDMIKEKLALKEKVNLLEQNLSKKSKKRNVYCKHSLKRFTPQQELSAEQAFWLRMSNPTSKPSDASPVKIEAPKEFPKLWEGVNLLSGSRDTNLYTISLDDMLKTSLICLLSKASKTKSLLWHRRLSHLNFGTLNKLAKDGLARGIPRLKLKKDHLCSACALGKSKKSSHQTKAEDTNQEKLYLLHMDLCGPMRVASINGKRYILVIVDEFTWVRFFRTKDEAPEAIIKCIKNIQARLNVTIRNVRTDNGTEFVNQTDPRFKCDSWLFMEADWFIRELMIECQKAAGDLFRMDIGSLIPVKVKSFDDALVTPVDCLEIGKCNMRLKTNIKPKEATFQVVLDALALTPFYQAFLITAEVPAIYMQEFWATVSVHKSSIRLMIKKKKFSLDVEIFREILQFCTKIPGQEFKDLPLEQNILSFVRGLGHTVDITYLTDVNVDYLHQPWRAFATIINKHEDTQVYYTILPKDLTNQAMLVSKAYQTYYAFASGEKDLKPKYIQKKADSDTSPKKKPVLNEQQQKVSGTNEGAGVTPEVPDEEEKADEEEVYSDRRVSTPPDYELTKEEEYKVDDDKDKDGKQEEKEDDLYRHLNINLERMQQQSYSVSSDLVSKFINPFLDTGIDSILNQDTQSDTLVNVPVLFDQRVSALESEMPKFRQTSQFVEFVSSILGIIDAYLASKMKEAVDVVVQLQTNKLREEAQAENQEFLNQFNTGNEDESPVREALNKDVWHRNPLRPPTPDREWHKTKTLKIDNLTQEVLTGPTYDLIKGVCKSVVELEYHLEEVFKATNDRLDWHNPEGKPYPHDLSKPLPLILNEQGRQVIRFEHFINNDLQYLKGGSSSQKYTTSITKTMAADYDHVKWIEDKGLKHKKFYGYASNMETSKDVYSRHMIIAVTSLKIMKWFGYSHLEEINVQRQDDQLYKFGEGNFKRLHQQDIKDMLLLLIQDKLTNLNLEERIEMEYLPKRKWSKQDRQRACVMIIAIDKKLKDKRLIRSLETFVGKRPYGGDLRLLERTIRLCHILSQLISAQRIKPTLYDGIVISAKHVAMPVIDDEEILILEEESRSKMSEKEKDPEAIKQNISHKPIDYEKLNRLSEDFGKRFTPQQELSAEQAFWLRMSNPTSKPSDASPVKIEAPKELPKVSLVNESLKKLKFTCTQF
ncbi:integrase, catalytic region, zinc finger, CCHC-type containing protein [Tanacetum coccineum]